MSRSIHTRYVLFGDLKHIIEQLVTNTQHKSMLFLLQNYFWVTIGTTQVVIRFT